MIGCCPTLLHASHSTQFADQFGFKIRALVCMQPLRDSLIDNEIVPETFCHSSSLLIGRWYGHGKLGKVVRQNQNILGVTGVGLQGKEIHAKRFQWTRWFWFYARHQQPFWANKIGCEQDQGSAQSSCDPYRHAGFGERLVEVRLVKPVDRRVVHYHASSCTEYH